MRIVFESTSLKMKIELIVFFCVLIGLASSVPGNGSKIINCFDASINDYNYQAYIKSDAGSCGGAIVSISYILTAAHCVQYATISKIQIRVGSSSYSSGGTNLTALNVIINPNYNQGNYDYDAALIKVSPNITTGSTIGIVTLASVNPELNTNVVVTGWGSTRPGSYVLSNTLKGAYENIKSKLSCRLAYLAQYTERKICAARYGVSTCNGDDGGPLVSVPSKQLVGIVLTSKYCIPGAYNLYTSVAAVSDWIQSII